MCEIKFEEITYPSADGKTAVHAYIWAPATGHIRGVIQLSHGMCEYVQRYDEWARRFAAAGFVFCGNDHLGHGHTASDEEKLGYTAPRGGADHLVEDLHTMTKEMKRRYPEVPLVLYGHSMGSFAARLYLARYGEELSAALISGTAGPEQPTAVAVRLARTVGRIKGMHHRSKLLTGLAFGNYNRKFEAEKDAFSWLSRDCRVRRAYHADPLCRFVFTAAGYETLFSLLSAVSRKGWAQSVPKELPMLLFAGEMDPVGNYGRGVRTVYERLRTAGCTHVELKLYENGRHEMHNEINREQVFEDLIRFLHKTPAFADRNEDDK